MERKRSYGVTEIVARAPWLGGARAYSSARSCDTRYRLIEGTVSPS